MESAVPSCKVLVAFMLEQGSKDTCRVVVGLNVCVYVCAYVLMCEEKKWNQKDRAGKRGQQY